MPRKPSPPSIDQIVALLDHPRARVEWVVRPMIDDTGKPSLVKVARIVVVRPVDGAGRLKVAVTDWGHDGNSYPPAQFIGTAGGYGYDKFTAALTGATVGGVELGDHSDYHGRQTLDLVARERGYHILG
jgi:hypothetical protein